MGIRRKNFLYFIAILIITAAALGFWYWQRKPTAELVTEAVVEAFSKTRLIEPRLSGGFLAGVYEPGPDKEANIDTTKLEKAEKYLLSEKSYDAETRHAHARMLLARRDVAEAIDVLRPLAADQGASAEVHNDWGACLFEQGRMEDALDEFNRALEMNPTMPEALFNRAISYQKLQLRDVARDELQPLVKAERDPGWAKDIEQRLEAISRPFTPENANKKIVDAFDKAMAEGQTDVARSITKESFESIRRHALVDLTKEYLQAAVGGDQAGSERAMSKLELIGNVLAKGRSDREIADLADFLNKLPNDARAIQLGLVGKFVEALWEYGARNTGAAQSIVEPLSKKFRESGNYTFELLSDSFTAQCYYLGKRYTDSRDVLAAALSRSEVSSRPYLHGRMLSQLAIDHSMLGQDSLAVKYSRKVTEICPDAPEMQAKTLQYASYSYWNIGDLDTALGSLRESTGLYLEHEAHPDRFVNLASNYSLLAEVYSIRNKPDLALRYAEQALVFADQAKNNVYGAEFSSFAAAEHARLGHKEEAEAALRRAYEYLAGVPRGRPHEAAEASVLTNAGEVAAQTGDVAGALDLFKRAEALAALDEGKILPKIKVLRGRAGAYAAAGQTVEARASLKRAAALIENYRADIEDRYQRGSFLAASQGVFDELISHSSKRPDLWPDAFEASERSRARALLDELSPTGGGAGSDQRRSVRPLTLAQVQTKLPPDMVLLEYSVTNNATYMFLITRGGFEVAVSPAGTDRLDSLVHDYVDDIKLKKEINEINEKAKELYRLLFGPISDRLKGYPYICVVPDKALHRLPLATLIDGSGNYLAETHVLTHAPSASVLIRCIEEIKAKLLDKPESMLAIGNPAFDEATFKDLKSLSDAETEATGSASFYTSDSIVLNGAQATEPNVRASLKQCEVAHLALHCLVKEDSPWLAALVLARSSDGQPAPQAGADGGEARAETPSGQSPLRSIRGGTARESFIGDPNDGLLHLDEVYDIKLPRTRLVVLSACQSGLGRYYRGEGMVSLVRPFLAAGAPTVAASLWPVDSEVTSQLMIEFHNHRKRSQLKSGDALRAAQVRMARTGYYQHPYYWGSFMVIGANN
ncbi:MAG TPA: CHAT domain-containing protein [Blastocatellia bacterium]|nr:CHAT domain-containing protein [Blastocatellia bacterium]